MSDLFDDSLERKLSDEEVSALLVLSDFSESNSSWSISMSFFNSSQAGAWGLSAVLACILSWLLDA